MIELGSSTAEVVGQLFCEIDRLSAEAAGCEVKTPLIKPRAESPPYLPSLGEQFDPPKLSSDELLEIVQGFMIEHASNLLDSGKQRSVPASFSEFMKEKYGDKRLAYGAQVCRTLWTQWREGGQTLDRHSAALLKALQQDKSWPLSEEILNASLEGNAAGLGDIQL